MWWEYVLGAVVLIVVAGMFASIVGFQTRWLSRRTGRTAEDMYDSYADRSPRPRQSAEADRGERSGGDNSGDNAG